jgi:hypothetical protein
MEKDHYIGLIVLLAIIAAAVFGGQKNVIQTQSGATAQPLTQPKTIDEQLADTQTKVTVLQQKIKAEEDAKTHSPYYGLVSVQFINRGNTPNYEYAVLHMSDYATTTVQISGFRLQSVASGQGVTIPNGVVLYWSGTINGQNLIILSPGDNVFLITGISPIGYNFKVNKCSGYLSQFQTFVPYLSTMCPAPRDENLSSIPRRIENNACLDYINSMPSCRQQINPLPTNFSYECTNFITTKLNYNSCISTHKDDKNFYQKEWRVYLGRSSTLWQSEREDIILYDANGKIVSELTY